MPANPPPSTTMRDRRPAFGSVMGPSRRGRCMSKPGSKGREMFELQESGLPRRSPSDTSLAASGTGRERAAAFAGKPQAEAGTAIRVVHGLDRSPVRLHDPLHDGQPEAGASRAPREERLEEAGARPRRAARPPRP